MSRVQCYFDRSSDLRMCEMYGYVLKLGKRVTEFASHVDKYTMTKKEMNTADGSCISVMNLVIFISRCLNINLAKAVDGMLLLNEAETQVAFRSDEVSVYTGGVSERTPRYLNVI